MAIKKGLSTNDYTDIEKDKLSGIEYFAQVNVNADWNSTTGKSLILNKPQVVNGSDKNFIYNQSISSDTWTIVHNLNKIPSITVIDSAGTVVIGEEKFIGLDTVILKFSGAFNGKAILN